MIVIEDKMYCSLLCLLCIVVSTSIISGYRYHYQSSISSLKSFRKLCMVGNSNSNSNSNRLIKKRDSRQSDDISTIDIGRTNKKSIASNNIKTISVKKRQSDENNDDVTSLTKQEGIY